MKLRDGFEHEIDDEFKCKRENESNTKLKMNLNAKGKMNNSEFGERAGSVEAVLGRKTHCLLSHLSG